MVRPTALLMGVVMLVVAAATYYGLAFVPPGLVPGVNTKTAQAPAAVAADAQTANAEPAAPVESATSPPAEATPAAEVAETTDMAAAAPAAEDVQEPATAAPLEGTGAALYGSSEAIERALANEPPPEGASVDSAARKQPKPVVEEKPAATPAPVAEKAPAPTAAPATPAKPAAAPAPKPASSEKPATATSEPKPAPSTAVNADALKQWWPDPSSMPANQLKLVYAGQVQGQSAIAVLFSASLDLASLKQHAVIKDDDGKTVPGNWEIGKNSKLAIISGLQPGRYTLVLGPEVSGGGFMLGRTLQGPVYVKAP